MSTPTVPPIFVPDVSREVGPQTQRAIRQIAQTLNQHEQAFAILKPQIDAKAPGPTSSAATAATPAATQAPASTASFGKVNNQVGTAYTIQDGDYGGLATFTNTQPVALSLNTACRQFWFGALQNLGPSAVTITPPSGTINNAATIQLSANDGAWLFFDGVNWWAATAGTLPATQAATAHEFLTSYNAATGTFTVAQPQFSDIAGTLALSQLPVAGISGSATLAALTPTGARGSLTFVDGMITGYSAPS